MTILKVDTISGIGTEGPVFEGDIEFTSQNFLTLPKGDTTQRGRGRGLWAGGTTGTSSNIIQYAELSSQGNTIDFGDLSAVNDSAMATASATRAVYGGGRNHPSYYNKIDTVEIATTGNATDFGDITAARSGGQGCGNQTRGLFGPGFNPSGSPTTINTIDFITIASTGNAQDFGDFTEVIRVGALSSPTRGIFAGGYGPVSPNVFNTIQFVTISTTGNGQDFGDVTTSRGNMDGGMCASTTRGLLAGGYVNPSPYARVNLIDFITIATTGNSTDFGDLTVTGSGAGANSNSLRGVFGGRTNPSKQQVIDFVEIATTGNAVDFGDMLDVFANCAGTSDSNGGLAE